MPTQIRELKDNLGNVFYPLTDIHALVNSGGTLSMDDVPTAGSENFVKSGGVYGTAVASTGYYECSTVGNTAAKTVTATGYILTEGGNLHIKFTNKNTSNGSITLNINSTGAKPLYYNGSPVTSSNSWADGETVDVYYDGTNFYANNATNNTIETTNPEFAYVVTDSEDKVLFGVNQDANFYFGAGVPNQIKDYIQSKIEELSLDEYEQIVAFLQNYLGTNTTLKTLLDAMQDDIDSKLDANGMDANALSGITTVNSPEYIQVTTDSDDKILEGIKSDGTKEINLPTVINSDLQVLGSLDISGATYSLCQSPEWIKVLVDSQERIIAGVRTDGSVYINEVTGDIYSIKQYLLQTESTINTLQNNVDELEDAVKTEVTEESLFEPGSISASDFSFIDDGQRIRSRVKLVANKINNFGINDTTNFLLLTYKYITDSNGNITRHIEGTSYTPTEDCYVWVIAKKSDDSYIADYDYENLRLFSKHEESISSIVSNKEGDNQNKNYANEYFNSIERIHQEEQDLQFKAIEESLDNLYLAKVSTVDSQTIQLPHSNGGLFILNVHKRANNGDDLNNNVYLPNVNSDFSDLCVLGDGKPLSLKKIYSGNIEILPNAALPCGGLVRINSDHNMYSTNVSGDAVYSDDGGGSWSKIPAFENAKYDVIFIDSQDNLYTHRDGVVYRSEKPYNTFEQVLNLRETTEGAILLSQNMIEHPITHRLFIATYQAQFDIHIFASDNFGISGSWNTVLRTSDYQHVHQLNIDPYQDPIAIYAGCDGGGAIYKSVDNGETWINLRQQNPDIPQATDQGMIYADPSGYRLSGGETAIIGGKSIQKTTDDLNFRTSLAIGWGVYFVRKLGSKLFAGTVSTQLFKNNAIMMSEDEGETWKTVYVTGFINNEGASDGFRYLSQIPSDGVSEEMIIAGLQSNTGYQSSITRSSVKILVGADHYYGQFLVDVPAGISSITVESGHFASKIRNIYNEYGTSEVPLFKLPFNLDDNLVVTDGTIVRSDYIKTYNGGRHIGGIYPAISSPNDAHSVVLYPGASFKVKDLDLSAGDFHIGFWCQMPRHFNNRCIKLLCSTSSNGYLGENIEIINHLARVNSNTIISIRAESTSSTQLLYSGNWDGAWIRIDINFTSNGKCQLFANGIPADEVTLPANSLSWLTANNYRCLYVPKVINGTTFVNDPFYIQYFEITRGNISAEVAKKNYYAGLFDI